MDIEQQKHLTRELSGLRFSEVVIQTSRFKQLVDWYTVFLGQEPSVLTDDSGGVAWPGNRGICFFRIYKDFPYTEVFGIFEFPDTELKSRERRAGPSIHHFQVRCKTYEDMFLRYERFKECGMTPFQSFNHGPGTSIYYHDPDNNIAEISAVNYDTEEDYVGYFQTEAYQKAFDGVPIDPDKFVAALRAGKSKQELVKIVI
jgi:catechol 2,3-dioxygenase-like lactoylglutathione lyase family enzyme